MGDISPFNTNTVPLHSIFMNHAVLYMKDFDWSNVTGNFASAYA